MPVLGRKQAAAAAPDPSGAVEAAHRIGNPFGHRIGAGLQPPARRCAGVVPCDRELPYGEQMGAKKTPTPRMTVSKT